MKWKRIILCAVVCIMISWMFAGCGQNQAANQAVQTAGHSETEGSGDALESEEVLTGGGQVQITDAFTKDTRIEDVINYPAFGDYGRLIFTVNEGYYSGSTLGTLDLTWYTEIRPDKTVEICNYFKDHADAGDVIFYDIYTDEEKAVDPSKNDTGLFFFKGEPGAKFAVVSSGGGMVYVGSMHDSFPHALEISKHGYNAFACIYRAGYDTGPEDCARAVAYIFEHADELEVDTSDY